jgi:hypothetical protein
LALTMLVWIPPARRWFHLACGVTYQHRTRLCNLPQRSNRDHPALQPQYGAVSQVFVAFHQTFN